MRDVNVEQNYGNIIENNYYGNENKYKVDFDLKETNLRKFIKSKMSEFVFSLISFIISCIFYAVKNHIENKGNLSIVFIVLALSFGIATIIIFLCCFCDLINIFKLKKNGKCINYSSKLSTILEFVKLMFGNGNASTENEISRLIKNENGKIYEIKGLKCPIYNSDPIGYMYPSYIRKDGEYIFECNENPNHRFIFDYKDKII